MTRNLSYICFGMALSNALLLKSFAVKPEWIGLIVFSVVLSTIFSHFMEIRSMGFAGLGGLSIAFWQSGGISLPATIMILFITVLVVTAVLLAMYADGCSPTNVPQGDGNEHEN